MVGYCDNLECCNKAEGTCQSCSEKLAARTSSQNKKTDLPRKSLHVEDTELFQLSSVEADEKTACPNVDGAKVFINGKISAYQGEIKDVTSPILHRESNKRVVIGRVAQFTVSEALEAARAAAQAWNNGQGTWPQMTQEARIAAIKNVVEKLKQQREAIIDVLMWEICKTKDDAAAEFDRTMLFIDACIHALRSEDNAEVQVVSGIMARVRRAGIGSTLIVGPFNYPFNETYTTLIPALLMGNTVVMKLPTIGGLAHVLTMEAYSTLPAGVVNFVSGAGRKLLEPIIKTGVDVLAFIGSSSAADHLVRAHPEPHRLTCFLSLAGKNLGIIAEDADLDVAAQECCVGSTNYNGQRCTAIKMMFVHESVADEFVSKLKERISKLKAGLPWHSGVALTPLPEPDKVSFLEELVADAQEHGAVVVNKDQGGGRAGGSLFLPAIVYPVDKAARLWHEEQFGPVVPIAKYRQTSEISAYIKEMKFGQQAAIFSKNSFTVAPLIDILSTAVGRINLNTQCGRSPDVFPFSARRSSGLGTLSVTEALKVFSISTVVAGKSNSVNEDLMKQVLDQSAFLAPLAKN